MFLFVYIYNYIFIQVHTYRIFHVRAFLFHAFGKGGHQQSTCMDRSIHLGYTLEGTCRLKTCEIPLVAICFYHLFLAAASTIFHASTQKNIHHRIQMYRYFPSPDTTYITWLFPRFCWFPGFSNGTSSAMPPFVSTQGQVCLQIGRERGENDLRKATRRGGHLSQGDRWMGTQGEVVWRPQGLQAAKMPRSCWRLIRIEIASVMTAHCCEFVWFF